MNHRMATKRSITTLMQGLRQAFSSDWWSERERSELSKQLDKLDILIAALPDEKQDK